MVRILKLGLDGERPKMYFKAGCPFCGAVLAFEYSDVWFDDPINDYGRIDCPNPKCRMKVHIHGSDLEAYSSFVDLITKEEYDGAITDTSKSGLQMLMDEKKQETRRLSPSEVADVIENEGDIDNMLENLANDY